MRRNSLLSITILTILFLFSFKTEADSSALPNILITVPDTVIEAGRDSILLPIYIDNFFDTISGIQFGLKITRPDLMKFDLVNGGFDTTGTLTAGRWGMCIW